MITPHLLLPIEDQSHVGNARRAAAELTTALSFDDTRAGTMALAVTEAATNIIKHAGRGSILLRVIGTERDPGVELLALDKGPGIANVSASLRDGHSTSGTSGTGLGALRRSSDQFEIYSLPGRGTALRLEIWNRADAAAALSFELGAVCVALHGEPVSGDDWRLEPSKQYLAVLVADGLGHGVDANRAARAATRVLAEHPHDTPQQLIERAHGALAPTRGAAVAAARLDPEGKTGLFAGVGNIVCRIETERTRTMISHNGIVGHAMRKVQEFAFPWPERSLAILASDGLGTHWNLADYPGLVTKHPGLIAGVLYRDFDRGRDDLTVIVIRNGASG